MTYREETGSYNNDYFEPILNEKTGFLHNIPYKIDKEKYLAVLEKHHQENRFKDTDIVSFHSDYTVDDEGNIHMMGFFAFPKNSPEDSNDFYDCFLFDGENVNIKYFKFVEDILECIIGADKECLAKLLKEKSEDLNKLMEYINTIIRILNSDKTCK